MVAFGVWYFTLRSGTETAPERNTIEVNLGGDATAEPPEQGTLDPSQ